MNMFILSLSRFQQADFVQRWKTKTCHGRRSWRTIHRFKDTSRFECLSKESLLHFQTILNEVFIRRLFSEFLWILLSSVLTPPWCKRLMWWVHCYSIGARDTCETLWKKCNFFQPGGEKALEIVQSKRKELAALMKASLPPCDRMGLICRFPHYTQEHINLATHHDFRLLC